MGKLFLAALLAAVVQFFWGFLFWSVLPLSKQVMQPIPEESLVSAALLEGIPATGSYFIPGPLSDWTDQAALEDFSERHKAGPIAHVFFTREGRPPGGPEVMGGGFVHFFISCLLMGILLRMVLPLLDTFMARLGFILTVAVFGVVYQLFGIPIWFLHPWDFYTIHAIYDIIGWMAGGAVLAWMIKADVAPTPSES